MTLSVTIEGGSTDLSVNMYRTSGACVTSHERWMLHSKIADLLEPAIYEAVRKLVRENNIKAATVTSDMKRSGALNGKPLTVSGC